MVLRFARVGAWMGGGGADWTVVIGHFQQQQQQQMGQTSVSIATQQQQQLLLKANDAGLHDKPRVALLLEINTVLLNEAIAMQERHAPNYEAVKGEQPFREYIPYPPPPPLPSLTKSE